MLCRLSSLPSSVPVKLAPFNNVDEPLAKDDYFQLSCTVLQGDYPFNFKWMFNKRPIYYKEGAKVQMVNRRSSNLIIETVSEKDAGNYSCIVGNRANSAITTTRLTIKGLFFLSFCSSSH